MKYSFKRTGILAITACLSGLFAMPLTAYAAPASASTPATATATSLAQQDIALQGQVSSTEEGKMEGVVVTAQAKGSTISISVLTDATGHYQFPRSKLRAGDYAIRIRATGFDANKGLTTTIQNGTTDQLNIELKKAADISSQLTNAEWIYSVPGTVKDKTALLNCVACHTLERVVKSKYTEQEFMSVILPRMQSYVNQSMPGAPQIRKGERQMEERGDQRIQVYQDLGKFLARINLSGRDTWTYPLQPFPRLKGASTKAIYTEYDLPRPTIQAHDVILDKKGQIWFSNFGEQKIGKVDPVTGALREIDVERAKPEWPSGILAMRPDLDGKIWIGNMYQASIARFDPETETFKFFTPPKEDNLSSTQLNQVSPFNTGVDGKVWAQNSGFAGVHRFDLETGKVETWAPFKDSKKVHNIYDVISDSKNNAFFTDFRNEHIGRIDAKTGEVKLFEIPTKLASPRRGSMDDQDRLWFGEYRGHRIGMFDTRQSIFKEWQIPTPYSACYDVVLDKDAFAWTGSMTTDRIARLNTQTDEIIEYQLPRSTNIRRVFVDNTGARPVLWVGNNHGASIVKVETLE